MKQVVGIDPGARGAAVLLDPWGEIARSKRIPARAVQVGKRLRRWTDAVGLRDLLREYQADAPGGLVAIVEAVSAAPGQDAGSVFSFGRSAGVTEAVLALEGIPVHAVSPRTWKGAYALPAGNKRGAREKASALFPDHADVWARETDHDIAEAALIALWGWRAKLYE